VNFYFCLIYLAFTSVFAERTRLIKILIFLKNKYLDSKLRTKCYMCTSGTLNSLHGDLELHLALKKMYMYRIFKRLKEKSKNTALITSCFYEWSLYIEYLNYGSGEQCHPWASCISHYQGKSDNSCM
jgi:hypothetical protein